MPRWVSTARSATNRQTLGVGEKPRRGKKFAAIEFRIGSRFRHFVLPWANLFSRKISATGGDLLPN